MKKKITLEDRNIYKILEPKSETESLEEAWIYTIVIHS